MARYFIQHTGHKKYLLVTVAEAARATAKYSWVEDFEDATNFRYQVTAFNQLRKLRLNTTTAIRGYSCIVLKEEYKGRIFEVANFETEE